LPDLRLEDNHALAGGEELRDNLAALYSARSIGVTRDDIVITSGESAAISTVLSSLLTKGDHVICQHPADELLYQIPTILGAEVTLWKAKPATKWKLDVEELISLTRESTKLIIIHSPCDPTGAIVPRPVLEKLIDFAMEKNLIILADEVSRPLFHSILPSSEDFPPSTINMGYRRVVVIGSVSKAYSLPGIKAGWIASRDKDILHACQRRTRLTSGPVSKLDEAVAAEALSDRCIHGLLAKNIKTCQTNLEVLQAFIDEHNWACSWVKPVAGTTGLIKFHKMGKPVDEKAFCSALHSQQGILVVPGPVKTGLEDRSDLRGHVRVAFAAPTSEFNAALEAWKVFMEESYETIPTVSTKSSG
jgi:aspartate/methionine/tyrosine aminotransferase